MNIHDNRWSDELGLPSDDDLRASAGLPDYETERRIKSELGLIDNVYEFAYISTLLKQNKTREARKVLSQIFPRDAIDMGLMSVALAKIHEKNHDYAGAAREAENAMQIFPENPDLRKFHKYTLSKAS
jgi:hypothetical protein